MKLSNRFCFAIYRHYFPVAVIHLPAIRVYSPSEKIYRHVLVLAALLAFRLTKPQAVIS